MSAERQPAPRFIENLEERTFFSVASVAETMVRGFPRPIIAQRANFPRAPRITSTATPTPGTAAQAGNWRGSNPFGILAKFNRVSGNWSSASPFSSIAQRIRG